MFDNFIGGRWISPARDRYLVMPRRSSGVRACRVPRSSADDVSLALDQALQARKAWSDLDAADRALALSGVAHRVGDHGLTLSLADCWDRGESAFEVSQHAAELVLESLTDPLYRQLVEYQSRELDRTSCGDVSEVVKLAVAADTEVDSMCRRVVPLLLEGHVSVVVLLYRECRRLPVRLLALMGVMAECLPAGVLNLVTGLGLEAGVALASSSRTEQASELACPCAHPSNVTLALKGRKQVL